MSGQRDVRVLRRAPMRGLALAAAAAVLLAACGGGDAGAASPPAAAGGAAPDLYLDRELELLTGGTRAGRDGYLQQLQHCRNTGMSTVPLAEADVDRIDTGRRQYWRTAGAIAVREEIWRLGAGRLATGDACHFRLHRTGSHVFHDARGSTYVDLASGETRAEPPEPELLAAAPVGDADWYRAPGWTGPVRREVAGQPCDEWTSPSGASTCTWTAGTRWGYVPAMTLVYDSASSDLGQLVLAAEPAPGTTGIRLRARSFQVGAGVDPARMRPEAAQ